MSLSIGEVINKLRTDRNWSLRELERRTHINYSVLSRIESGKRPVTDAEIKVFSNVFSVSPNELLGTSYNPTLEIFSYRLGNSRRDKKMTAGDIAEKLNIPVEIYKKFEQAIEWPSDAILDSIVRLLDVSKEYLLVHPENPILNAEKDSTQKPLLSPQELKVFEELKKHPILFHDLASNPEKKIKELIKLQKMKRLFLDEEDEEYGEGFGDLED